MKAAYFNISFARLSKQGWVIRISQKMFSMRKPVSIVYANKDD